MVDQEQFSRLSEELAAEVGSLISGMAPTEGNIARLRNALDALRGAASHRALFARLIAGEEPQDLEAAAAELGVDPNGEWAVFAVETNRGDADAALGVLEQLAEGGGAAAAFKTGDGRLALVMEKPEKSGWEEMHAKAHVISDMLSTEAMVGARVGFGTAAKGLLKLRRSYGEGVAALSAGNIFMSGETVCSYEKMGIARLVADAPADACRLFLEETFGDFRPSQLGEEMRNLADTFLANNLSITDTSRRLFLHRNTLVYRIEKIKAASGLDIRHFEDAMAFYLGELVEVRLKAVKE